MSPTNPPRAHARSTRAARGMGLAAAGLCLCFAGAARAQTADAGPAAASDASAAADVPPVATPSKIWSVNLGVDFTTDYYFRGIKRENQGLIAQPWGDFTLALWDRQGPAVVGGDASQGEAVLSRLTWTVGSWNSLHSGPTGTQDDAPGLTLDNPRAWFESDLYTSLNATLFEDWQASVIYTAYLFPNEAHAATQEVAFGIGYDDSRLLGAFSLKPNVLFAVETAGGMDGEHGELGTYFQFSVEPGFRLLESRDYPVWVRFPMAVGLSLSDYYEDASGRDQTFGFFSAGVVVSVPLAFVPRALGSWELKTGVHVVTAGAHAADLAAPAVTKGHGDDVGVVGTVGISMNY